MFPGGPGPAPGACGRMVACAMSPADQVSHLSKITGNLHLQRHRTHSAGLRRYTQGPRGGQFSLLGRPWLALSSPRLSVSSPLGIPFSHFFLCFFLFLLLCFLLEVPVGTKAALDMGYERVCWDGCIGEPLGIRSTAVFLRAQTHGVGVVLCAEHVTVEYMCTGLSSVPQIHIHPESWNYVFCRCN